MIAQAPSTGSTTTRPPSDSTAPSSPTTSPDPQHGRRGHRRPEPLPDMGDTTPEDEAAWRAATRRFRRTGQWFGRWGTGDECGAVLLPDSASHRCAEHQPPGH